MQKDRNTVYSAGMSSYGAHSIDTSQMSVGPQPMFNVRFLLLNSLRTELLLQKF